MRYTVEKHERYVVIEPLVAQLDGEASAKLKGEFMLRNTTGQRNIVLDLIRVESITEEGMRTGLLADRLCQSLGGMFILVGLQSQVINMLKMAKLDGYFTIVKKLKDAEDLIYSHEVLRDLKDK